MEKLEKNLEKSKKIEVGSIVKSKSGYIAQGVVVSFLPNSRTVAIVKDTDRGKGWDESRMRYNGVASKGGWMRGVNNCFGMEFEKHISTLELV